MLEDELREMFGTRVSAPPAALDPAGIAIKQGKGKARRRKTVTGIAAVLAFLGLITAATVLQSLTTPVTTARDGVLGFAELYGQPESPAAARPGDKSSSPLKFPVDVFAGGLLWTADGRKLTLNGVQSAMKVVRVPAGWLYSDEDDIFLLRVDGSTVHLKAGAGAWAVSLDGTRIAAMTSATTLETWRADGSPIAAANVKAGTRPEGFDGESKVILTNTAGAHDHWSGGGGSTYLETWNAQVTAVFGAERDKAVGVVKEKDASCLAELAPADSGWKAGLLLGCGELPAQAVRAGAVRSPDGKWLAIPTATGVQLVDLKAAKTRATASVGKTEALTAQFNCAAMGNAPAVWIDAESVVTTTGSGEAIACGTDGSRVPVKLPTGVSAGWLLVPRFGDLG